MAKKSVLASIFLKEFTKHLVLNSKPKYKYAHRQPIQKDYTHREEDFQPSMMPIPKINPRHQRRQTPRFQRPAPRLMSQGKPVTYSESDLGDISKLLKDPAVMSLECPGPGKPILVNRSGIIQNTSIILQHEQIKKIVNNFAEQARIPLAGKVFKAALGNLIITAILSEFVGTRFMIQKKVPQIQQR